MRGLNNDKPDRLGGRGAPGLKIVVIVVVSIGLMMLDHAHDGLSSVRGVLAAALEPVQIAAELPGDTADYLRAYFDRPRLIRDNQKLSRQVLLLQGRLQKLAALQAENERIRALLGSGRTMDQNVMIARILSASPHPYRQYVKLNKGRSDGVFVGQALIDANGVMGQVTEVTPLGAKAVLISDADNGIPVDVNRTGLHTIARGTGRADRLSLPFLPVNADVKAGDLLVSSGLGGRYPPNYPVAVITRVVHRPGEEFLDVSAKPTAHLGRGREVLLVWRTAGNAAPKPSNNARRTGTAHDHRPRESPQTDAPAR